MSPAETAPNETISVVDFLVIAAQLALVEYAVHELHVVSHAFDQLLLVALAGFAIHSFLPLRDRLRFFVLLSLTGLVVVLGPGSAALLTVMSLSLIAIASLPLRLSKRVLILAATAALLASLRGGWLHLPSFSEAAGPVWPILGSMFMFRMIVYLYDRSHETMPPSGAQVLSYFFLMPNVCFPLFPIVDFKTFCRAHYAAPAREVYQRGVLWLLIGVTHLLLFRIVKYHFVIDLSEVQNARQLARCLVTGYLLYLRVSGEFHIICGFLHLFGFQLPETHRWFFFAPTLGELSRRINAYWSGFVSKLIYLPTVSRCRHRGLAGPLAMTLGILLVYVASVTLHAYQWFWIRGVFPLTWADALFWFVIDAAILAQALRSTRPSRGRSRARIFLARALGTATTFSFICIMWSIWNSESLREWWGITSSAIVRW